MVVVSNENKTIFILDPWGKFRPELLPHMVNVNEKACVAGSVKMPGDILVI